MLDENGLLEVFRERLSIMVIDGGMDEGAAAQQAFFETARLYKIEPRSMPQAAKDEMKKAVSKRLA